MRLSTLILTVIAILFSACSSPRSRWSQIATVTPLRSDDLPAVEAFLRDPRNRQDHATFRLAQEAHDGILWQQVKDKGEQDIQRFHRSALTDKYRNLADDTIADLRAFLALNSKDADALRRFAAQARTEQYRAKAARIVPNLLLYGQTVPSSVRQLSLATARDFLMAHYSGYAFPGIGNEYSFGEDEFAFRERESIYRDLRSAKHWLVELSNHCTLHMIARSEYDFTKKGFFVSGSLLDRMIGYDNHASLLRFPKVSTTGSWHTEEDCAELSSEDPFWWNIRARVRFHKSFFFNVPEAIARELKPRGIAPRTDQTRAGTLLLHVRLLEPEIRPSQRKPMKYLTVEVLAYRYVFAGQQYTFSVHSE